MTIINDESFEPGKKIKLRDYIVFTCFALFSCLTIFWLLPWEINYINIVSNFKYLSCNWCFIGDYCTILLHLLHCNICYILIFHLLFLQYFVIGALGSRAQNGYYCRHYCLSFYSMGYVSIYYMMGIIVKNLEVLYF